ncbi:MAG: ubiquinol-cytochrome c reductase iron-sulfur subunit [Calditrichaeota bacterium]|nr:ubiquinol-cytochrome c reductase iron-sulfur subunit [Calditrichota bacterium]
MKLKPNNAADKKKNSKKNKTRRQFMGSIGHTASGMAVAGGLVMVYKYLYPNVLLEIPSRFKIASVASLQPGSHIFNPEHRVFVFHETRGYFYAVSAVCTHLGCTVAWDSQGITDHKEGIFLCPCHGSEFTKEGDVIRGPARRHLDRYHPSVEDGQLVVDTSETVKTIEEMILKV